MSAEQERLAEIEERVATFWRYTIDHGDDGISVGHSSAKALEDVSWLLAQLRQAQEREAALWEVLERIADRTSVGDWRKMYDIAKEALAAQDSEGQA